MEDIEKGKSVSPEYYFTDAQLVLEPENKKKKRNQRGKDSVNIRNKKEQIGRNKFIDEVWKWKEESGDQILNQLKKLGCSCDWSRNRFTMDKDLSEAVIKTFVLLYNKKIIYKDTKLVNWDTKLETAISDLEVEQKEVQSKLYYIKYQIENEINFGPVPLLDTPPI